MNIIEPKHLKWIFDAAAEYFAEKIRELEWENIILKSKIHEPLYTGNRGSQGMTREDMIKRNEGFIEQYILCLDFCKTAQDKCAEKLAEEFAEDFKDFLTRREEELKKEEGKVKGGKK